MVPKVVGGHAGELETIVGTGIRSHMNTGVHR